MKKIVTSLIIGGLCIGSSDVFAKTVPNLQNKRRNALNNLVRKPVKNNSTKKSSAQKRKACKKEFHKKSNLRTFAKKLKSNTMSVLKDPTVQSLIGSSAVIAGGVLAYRYLGLKRNPIVNAPKKGFLANVLGNVKAHPFMTTAVAGGGSLCGALFLKHLVSGYKQTSRIEEPLNESTTNTEESQYLPNNFDNEKPGDSQKHKNDQHTLENGSYHDADNTDEILRFNHQKGGADGTNSDPNTPLKTQATNANTFATTNSTPPQMPWQSAPTISPKSFTYNALENNNNSMNNFENSSVYSEPGSKMSDSSFLDDEENSSVTNVESTYSDLENNSNLRGRVELLSETLVQENTDNDETDNASFISSQRSNLERSNENIDLNSRNNMPDSTEQFSYNVRGNFNSNSSYNTPKGKGPVWSMTPDNRNRSESANLKYTDVLSNSFNKASPSAFSYGNQSNRQLINDNSKNSQSNPRKVLDVSSSKNSSSNRTRVSSVPVNTSSSNESKNNIKLTKPLPILPNQSENSQLRNTENHIRANSAPVNTSKNNRVGSKSYHRSESKPNEGRKGKVKKIINKVDSVKDKVTDGFKTILSPRSSKKGKTDSTAVNNSKEEKKKNSVWNLLKHKKH